jgi:hypothetical protein
MVKKTRHRGNVVNSVVIKDKKTASLHTKASRPEIIYLNDDSTEKEGIL